MKKIGVIVNPFAKKVRTGKIKTDIFNDIGEDLVDIRITESLDELDFVLGEFRQTGISYIGVTGGDGSLHHVLSRLVHLFGKDKIPPLLILKGGTMDNVSKTIHLKGTGPAILKRFVERIYRNQDITLHERDTIEISDRFCFLFGNGMTASFLNEVYRGEKGPRANARGIAKIIGHGIKEPKEGSLFEGLNAEITVDGMKLDFTRITAILAGTVESISVGATPLYNANVKTGSFHALITGLTPLQILMRIYKLVKGRQITMPNHFDGVISSMKLQSEKPFEYTMDGDIYVSDGTLEVNTGPRIKLVYV